MATSKKSFRSRLMKYAHHIFSTGFSESWSYCLRQAWRVYFLFRKLKTDAVRFSYKKLDGTIREAYGTLMKTPVPRIVNGKKVTKQSYKTMCYFDLDLNAYRCFRVENLL